MRACPSHYIRIQQISINENNHNESDLPLIFPRMKWMAHETVNERKKTRVVIREDYFVNKPAGCLSKHTQWFNTSIQLYAALLPISMDGCRRWCVTAMTNCECFTFCVQFHSMNSQITNRNLCRALEPRVHGAHVLYFCYKFNKQRLHSFWFPFIWRSEIRYDPTPHTNNGRTHFGISQPCAEIKMMRARYTWARRQRQLLWKYAHWLLLLLVVTTHLRRRCNPLSKGNATVSFNETHR